MNRLSATATPEHIAPIVSRVLADWQRKGLLSLYTHAGLSAPLHLLPVRGSEGRAVPRGDG